MSSGNHQAQLPLITKSSSSSATYGVQKAVMLIFLVMILMLAKTTYFPTILSENKVGTAPEITQDSTWHVEIPHGQILPGAREAPMNYATRANPWAFLSFEGPRISAPLNAFKALHFPWTSTVHIRSEALEGFHKHGYRCQMEGTKGIVPGFFVIKVSNLWHPPHGPARSPEGFLKKVEDMILDYETQVALSYLSFIYSTSSTFKAGAAKRLKYPRNGKFAYSHPVFVKVTDLKSNMWTVGLIDREFGTFVKVGDGHVPLEHFKWADDFGFWVAAFTGAESFPTSQLSVNDEQGFWFDSPSLFMTDGQLYNPEDLPSAPTLHRTKSVQPDEDMSAAASAPIEGETDDHEIQQLEEIQRCLTGNGGLLEILANGAERAPVVKQDYYVRGGSTSDSQTAVVSNGRKCFGNGCVIL